MRLLNVILAALLCFSQPAVAQESEVEGVIGAQIDAFRADDFATAFTYASPMIRDLFGSADNFGLMVRQGYPMVWRPAELRFLDLRQESGRVRQRVMITDSAGNVHLLDYEMVRLDGVWKINGVFRVRPDALST